MRRPKRVTTRNADLQSIPHDSIVICVGLRTRPRGHVHEQEHDASLRGPSPRDVGRGTTPHDHEHDAPPPRPVSRGPPGRTIAMTIALRLSRKGRDTHNMVAPLGLFCTCRTVGGGTRTVRPPRGPRSRRADTTHVTWTVQPYAKNVESHTLSGSSPPRHQHRHAHASQHSGKA